jgi:hypothetical protein
VEDSLAVLLLPGKLEGFEREAHARELLSIPRVLALEASGVRAPRFLREAASLRQARRLRFPGRLRLVVLYHPAQYPLARALCSSHEAELWYIPPGCAGQAATDDAQASELHDFDELARHKATQTLSAPDGGQVPDAPLRLRLRELEVINPHAFIPGARLPRR